MLQVIPLYTAAAGVPVSAGKINTCRWMLCRAGAKFAFLPCSTSFFSSLITIWVFVEWWKCKLLFSMRCIRQAWSRLNSHVSDPHTCYSADKSIVCLKENVQVLMWAKCDAVKANGGWSACAYCTDISKCLFVFTSLHSTDKPPCSLSLLLSDMTMFRQLVEEETRKATQQCLATA